MQSPDEILARLKKGNERFVDDKSDGELSDAPRRRGLTDGQSPWAVVLSCADSRVVPELAFDTGLGELFVLRVAGNVANTSTVASIEYAVANLGSPVIVVMGHESCGAVTAAVGGADHGRNLNHLLAHIKPAIAKAGDAPINDVVKTNARLVADELVERSPIIAGAVKDGKLKIVPAYYEIGSGKVDFL